MIIEKNMNIKIDLNSDLVSEYFKHCLDNTTELSDIVDKLDTNVLSYIAAYYVGKSSREDPAQYAKFKQFLPKSIDEEMTEAPPTKTESIHDNDFNIEVGDTIFKETTQSMIYVYWDRWKVVKIKKSETLDDYVVYMDHAYNPFRASKIYLSELREMIREEEAFVAKK